MNSQKIQLMSFLPEIIPECKTRMILWTNNFECKKKYLSSEYLRVQLNHYCDISSKCKFEISYIVLLMTQHFHSSNKKQQLFKKNLNYIQFGNP